MCGLLGFAAQEGADFPPELAGFVVNKLQLRNEVRGGDSFGLGLVEPAEGQTRLYKTVGRLSNLSDGDAPEWQGGLRRLMRVAADGDPIVAIGHNRKATVGANTERNAHPFKFGKEDRGDLVIGAHNGVVGSWREIGDEWDFYKEMQVDSEAIFRGLQKYHTEDDPDQYVIGKLVPMASMALTYMLDFETLRLFRGSNPLSVAIGDGFMFWSSKEKHLQDETFGLNLRHIKLSRNRLMRVNIPEWDFSTRKIDLDQTLRASLYTGSQRGGYYHNHSGRGTNRRQRRSDFVSDQGRRAAERDPDRHLFAGESGVPRIGPTASANTSEEGDKEDQDESRAVDREDDDNSASGRDTAGVGLDQLDSEVDAQIRPRIWALNTSEHMHDGEPVGCTVCDDEYMREDETAFRWQLLWYNGEPFCPVCFYYLIQAEAEEDLTAILDNRGAK